MDPCRQFWQPLHLHTQKKNCFFFSFFLKYVFVSNNCLYNNEDKFILPNWTHLIRHSYWYIKSTELLWGNLTEKMFVKIISKLKLIMLGFLVLFWCFSFSFFALQYARKEHWEGFFVRQTDVFWISAYIKCGPSPSWSFLWPQNRSHMVTVWEWQGKKKVTPHTQQINKSNSYLNLSSS